jgi:hypothetical protein
MSKLILALLMAATFVILTGCESTESGSREYIPGKGWEPVE